MNVIVFAMPGNEEMANRLAGHLGATRGELTVRAFPDGETYVRLLTDCDRASVVIVATLDRPDAKLLRILFAADTARDMGAQTVGLVAPYLAYMRQDKRFNHGEAITSRTFAGIVSAHFDWLVTVDPHLHRFHSMDDLYSIPVSLVHAAPSLGAWIRQNVDSPLVIGPDVESRQWVEEVATAARCPFAVLNKERRGDRDVRITAPDLSKWRDRTPVLVDDIISTARTMAESAKLVRKFGFANPVAVGVHAVFAEGAERALRDAGVSTVVTSNTLPHGSNLIDLSQLLADAVPEVGRRVTPTAWTTDSS